MSFTSRRAAISARGTGFFNRGRSSSNAGRMWATGRNLAGNLGLGDTTDRNALTLVGLDNDWVQVSSGEGFSDSQMFTIALKANGTIWATGYNGDGQLGLGNTTNQTSFVQIGTDTDWAYVVAGLTGALAIKTNGTLWAWGDNALYKFGLPSAIDYLSPTQIGSSTDWSIVDTNGYASMAIKTDGTLWSVGRNETGKFGDGTYTSKTTWSQIGSDTDWKKIKMSDPFSVAQKTNGYLYSTGLNIIGRLGIGADNPTLCTCTSSDATTDEFTCDTTASLVAYTPGNTAPSAIVFRPTVFGGINEEGITSPYVYYVKSIPSATTFTISSTPGGATVQLTTATGSMIAKAAYINTWTQVTPNYDWKEYDINQNIIWALDPSYNQYFTSFAGSDIDLPAPTNTVYVMTAANVGSNARQINLGFNSQSIYVESNGYAYVYGLNTNGMLNNGANVGATIDPPTQVTSIKNVIKAAPGNETPVTFIIAP